MVMVRYVVPMHVQNEKGYKKMGHVKHFQVKKH